MNRNASKNIFISRCWVVLLLIILTGCGTVQHNVAFQEGYNPQSNMLVDVGSVINETGNDFDIDIEKMLSDALVEALNEKQLLSTGNEGNKLIIETKIVSYTKGDAFKRWLMPGWGETALIIQSDLRDNSGIVVGSVTATRTVTAGGGYTIGAWKTVFTKLAKDVVDDLQKNIQKPVRLKS